MNYSEEERKAIEKIRSFNQYNWEMNNLKGKEFAKPYFDALDTILNLIQKQDKIIDNAIKEVEKIRCYFSEDVQVEFIRVLEILKDKNVKDW